ncbi:MAG: very short patch repair endonuclease [Hyphomicrobium sp.]|uniref:very short patch repair endonuclease n=1 Tax=Hyphomicrobium sp. TaxID=82 RepID=UPI00356AC564
MARIRKTDTRPEIIVRRAVHALGFRFRLHRRDLPGSPDLVLPRHRKVIFVHGCFWHRHDCRDGRKLPNSRPEYWGPKLARNAARDSAQLCALAERGWDALVLWECELKDRERLIAGLRKFLQCPVDARLQASQLDQAKRRPPKARPLAPRAARR